MLTDQKLLRRAAMVTVLIALCGVGLLYLITRLAETGSPRLLDSQQENAIEPAGAGAGTENPRAGTDDGILAEVAADRAFIRHVFPLISAWNLEDVQPYFATQTLRQSQQNHSFHEVFAVLSDRLGKLEDYTEPGYVLPAVNPDLPPDMHLAEYEFMAYYEKGNALVNLVVQQDAGIHNVYAVTISVLDDGREPALEDRLILAGTRSRDNRQSAGSRL